MALIKYVTTILLVFALDVGWAQPETDTVSQETTIVDQRLQDGAKWQQKWDSIQSAGQAVPAKFLQKADSLNPLYKVQGRLDSLKALSGQFANPAYWEERSKLLQKLDSLSNTPQYYLYKIDSLVQAKTELLQQKIFGLQEKAGVVGEKLDGINADGLGVDKLGNQMQEKLGNNLGELSPELYQKQMQKVNGLIQEYTGKVTDLGDLQFIQHYTSQLDQIETKLQGLTGKLLNSDQLSFLQGYGQQLQNIGQESKGYFKLSQDLLAGGLSDDSPLMQALEQKVGHFREFQELKKQTAELEKLKQMPNEYKEKYGKHQDKEFLKQQALAKAKELGTKHFAEHQDKLKAAQQTLAKYKKKYSAIQSTKDMSTAVKRNSLKGKPLGERLILGGTFQINKDPTAVDISPLLGYKLNKKTRLGAGVTYRANLDFKDKQVLSQNQVYGWRGFFEREAFKGFFGHAEFESMNSEIPDPNNIDAARREWVHGALVGIGKEYNLIKNIKGQVMVLYNFMHEGGKSPYDKPLVIRFGFVL